MTRALGSAIAACLASALALSIAHAASPDASPATPVVTESRPAGESRPAAPFGPEVPRGAVERLLAAYRQNDYTRAAELTHREQIFLAALDVVGPDATTLR